MSHSRLEAVIFDMDGVLIDSEPIADRLLCEIMARFGVDLSFQELRELDGMSGLEFWRHLKGRYDLPRPVEFYIAEYDESAEIAAYDGMAPVEGGVELIDALIASEVTVGLATSASRRRMNAVVDLFQLRRRLGALVCADDVRASKPNPEIFRIAAARLGVSPANCVVIEDSRFGVEAATRAGMKVVGYTGLGVAKESLEGAALFVENFMTLTVENLKTLWDRP